MFSFFRPKTELGIVFHIGSASVAAGLVRFSRTEIPHVVYMLREHVPYQTLVAPEKLFADMIAALKRANARIVKEGAPHLNFTRFGSLRPRRVYYVFSSPWAAAQTKIVAIREEEPFTLTQEMVDRVVDTHEKMFEAETLGASVADVKDKLAVIEKRVVQIKLDGYEVSDPIGRRVREAEVSLYTSLVPKAVLDKVLDASEAYHARDTQAFSFPLVSFSAIRDVFHSHNDFVFLDIGGELSDVSVVKNGLILETASFPLGRHFVVRKAAKTFATGYEQALSLIRMHHEGRATPEVDEKVAAVLKASAAEWLEAFRTVLSKLSTAAALPTDFFVLMASDLTEFFMKALREEKISEFGLIDAPLSVTLVNHDKLKAAVSFGKGADKDPFIAIIAAFAGRVYGLESK